MVMDDVAAAVQAEIDELTAAGINKIILISHLQGVDEDIAVASQLSGVDIVIAGGGDELLANSDDLLVPGDESEVFGDYPQIAINADGVEVPVVTTAGNYKYVGKLVVDFDADGNLINIDDASGPVRVAGGMEADAVEADAQVIAEVVDPVSAALADLEANIIGVSEVGLDGVRGNIRSIETNLGNLITDAFLWQAEQVAASFGVPVPDVAIQNGGGIRNDNVIPAGDISTLTTFDILPFSNFLTVIPDIPAEQFKEILENAVSRIGSGSGTGRFAQLGGVSIVYDPTGTPQELDDEENVEVPGTRIISAVLADGRVIVADGAVVADAPAVSVATADFLARGGDQYPFRGAAFTSLGLTYQQVLENYIVDGLGGEISAADYAEGGEGRIRQLSFSEPLTLTVLHNNDAESQLINAPGQPDFGGAARFKTLVDQLRDAAEEDGAAIMLSSGDNFLAGPEFNASTSLPDNVPFFESVVIDRIGYDAMAIGNHEFDFGPDVLERLISDITNGTPFLSANLDFSGEAGLQGLVDAGRIAKSVVVEKDGQLIGVVGATTPNLPFISSPRNVVVMEDVAAAVRAEVGDLTSAGINKIILISHLQGVTEDQELLSMLTDVDIVIAGGGDELLANSGDLLVPGDESEVFGEYPLISQDMNGVDVPVVTTAGNFKYVGQLIVEFDEAGMITSISDESGPVRVAGGMEADAVEADAGLVADVQDPVAASLESLAADIIGTSEVGLDGVRGNIRSIETNLGNLITDAFIWQSEQLVGAFGVPVPDVAIQNGGGIRNDNVIPAGDISTLTTFDILPFSNFLTIVPEIPADQFKEILENAFSRVEGGSGTGRYAQVAGVKVVIDIDATAQELDDNGNVATPGNRVISAMLDDGRVIVMDGKVVDDAPAVNIAIADFLARGGDQYPFRGASFTSLGVTYQQTLANFIKDGLGGAITAADYPEGGEGRVVRASDLVGSAFSLIDADTDAAISGFDPIQDGATLDLTTLPGGLNIAANISAEGVAGVIFNLNGSDVRLEGVAPYALFGDVAGDFSPGNLPVGSHVLTATALGADGEVLAVETVSFSVVNGDAPMVTGLVLVDAATDADIAPLTDGSTLDLGTLPAGLNVRAEVGGAVKSVTFSLNNDSYHRTENVAPFALFGDTAGDYFGATFNEGVNTLAVTPFDQSMAKGAAGTTLEISFNVTGNAAGKLGAPKGRFVEPLDGTASEDELLPDAFALQANYPNPFNPTTTIAFSIPEQANVKLEIYNVLGRQVRTLVSGQVAAGQHEVAFEAGNLPSGTYFYRLVTPAGTFVKQMILLK